MNGNAPLEIRLPDSGGEAAVEQAVQCLREAPFVTEILRPEPALLRIRLDGDQEACGAVLRELVLRGVPVTDFHRAPMNLEKVFMEVTQDDA